VGEAVDVDRVRASLSAERFASFLKAAGGDDHAALALYEWDSEVAGEFFKLLRHFEIALRNAAHRELVVLFRRADWWAAPGLRLSSPMLDMIAKAQDEAARRRAAAIPGDTVAALSFGFWVGLFSAGRSQNYELSLWRPALHRAFPGYAGPRADLHQKLELLRLLRNRIAHNEPIYRRHLAADHGTIFRLTEWISPTYADWVRGQDRAPEVLARRPGTGSRPASALGG
jgi:hypothetical protein